MTDAATGAVSGILFISTKKGIKHASADVGFMFTVLNLRLSPAGNLRIGTAAPTQRPTVFNGTTTGTYTTTGWAHSSDGRMKKNIQPIENAMSLINNLNGIYYNWKNENEKSRQLGFIAQDVKKVLPEVVVGTEGKIENGETLGMIYQNIVPVLVEALKEKHN